mmetsp:Transcript_3683/g.5506  ORF Transcript_3683/g.5506 Transcript_3683/m.5506 type:complete len:80 (-) Transcript_3683:1437-1676(-)
MHLLNLKKYQVSNLVNVMKAAAITGTSRLTFLTFTYCLDGKGPMIEQGCQHAMNNAIKFMCQPTNKTRTSFLRTAPSKH